MNLILDLSQRLDDATLSPSERASLQCQIAGEFETAGDYESARQAMNGVWQRIGERPRLDGLENQVKGEVLLRAGSLTGWIGSASQIDGAQETAKDLLSESAAIFTDLGRTDKVAEANIALALSYWREGSFDEARVTLQQVLSSLDEDQAELKVRALLNIAMVDGAASKLNDALQTLMEAAPLLEGSDNHSLLGRFYAGLGTVLKNLGLTEERDDYIDRALIEYAASSFHLEQAGHVRFYGRVENNLGFLFLERGRIEEANDHLDRARRIFVELKDFGTVAQVDDTRARVFLAAGDPEKAERLTRTSVRTLETGGEQAILAEAFTTRGKALARLGRRDEALSTFDHAIGIAEHSGNKKSAGLAALTLLEEIGSDLSFDNRLLRYDYADQMLADKSPRQILNRLRVCARQCLKPQETLAEQPRSQSQALSAESNQPWAGCTLEQEVLVFEGELIKRALDTTRGSVTRAARLLGITHQGLAFILQGRHKSLLTSRTPARPRRRSLMRPDLRKSKKKNRKPA